MKINAEIKRALRKAADDYGNVHQLSKRLGVAHSTILFWLDGKTSNINGDIWYNKVLPILMPYLSGQRSQTPTYGQIPPASPLGIGEKTSAYAPLSEITPVQTMREVPVISFAQAAGFDPALEPFDDFAKDCSDESAIFAHEVRDGYFALRVEGSSMSPNFPDGTILLVAGGEYPQRGDIVIAKVRETGQVVVKEYSRSQNVIRLESINPEGLNFEWNCKENRGFIEWMYPVLEANINLRKQRWEKLKP